MPQAPLPHGSPFRGQSSQQRQQQQQQQQQQQRREVECVDLSQEPSHAAALAGSPLSLHAEPPTLSPLPPTPATGAAASSPPNASGGAGGAGAVAAGRAAAEGAAVEASPRQLEGSHPRTTVGSRHTGGAAHAAGGDGGGGHGEGAGKPATTVLSAEVQVRGSNRCACVCAWGREGRSWGVRSLSDGAAQHGHPNFTAVVQL